MTPDSSGTLHDQASDWAVDYARRSGGLFEPTDPDEVRIDLVTDPWSVWCWGLEPVARALAHRYPAITFRPLVGGMFERVPHHEHPEFDLSRFLARVQRVTGVPVATGAFQDGGPDSTYPACVHAHAMRLLDASRAQLGLRKLREAAWLDGRDVSDPAVAADVARSVGYDPEAFRAALHSGEPEREFRDRMGELERLELHSYPTLVVTAGETTRRHEGFLPLPALVDVVERVGGRTPVRSPPPEPLEALDAGHRVATREAAEVLDVSIERAAERLTDLADAGRVERQRFPTGDAWIRTS